MALKDWKKVGKYKWQEKTVIGRRSHKIITIEVPNAFGNKQSFDLVQVTTDGRLIDRIKSFKTKSEALRYAKKYMRKN